MFAKFDGKFSTLTLCCHFSIKHHFLLQQFTKV